MSPAKFKFKPPRNKPKKLAFDIIRNIIANKGPIETKDLWALSQEVKPTPAELEQDRLESEPASEISQLTTSGWVTSVPPEDGKPPPGLSKAEQRKYGKLQAALERVKKHDNGHPVKSTRYLKDVILPPLVHLREIEKVHMRRKLTQEEVDAKLRSMTLQEGLRKGPALSTAEVSTWAWRLKQRTSRSKPKTKQNSKILEEVYGKNYDLSHLSRQERLEMIERDISWAKTVVAARMQGAAETTRESEKPQVVHSVEVKEQKALVLEVAELPAPSASRDP